MSMKNIAELLRAEADRLEKLYEDADKTATLPDTFCIDDFVEFDGRVRKIVGKCSHGKLEWFLDGEGITYRGVRATS